MNKQTPEQKAAATAAQIRANLECSELQDALNLQALSNARRRAWVARQTMSDRVAAKVEEKLLTARAVRALPASEQQLLGQKQPKSGRTDRPGQAKRARQRAAVDAQPTDTNVQ